MSILAWQLHFYLQEDGYIPMMGNTHTKKESKRREISQKNHLFSAIKNYLSEDKEKRRMRILRVVQQVDQQKFRFLIIT